MNDRMRARLEILAAAALFSTGGAAIKACSLGGWQVAMLRSAFGAAGLLILVPASRRALSARALWVGIAYAATLLLFVHSNKLTTAANAIFLQSTAPLYLLLMSPLLLHEGIRRRELLYMGALAAGMALFLLGMEPPRATATNPVLGNWLAAASGLSWALTVAGLRWLARSEGEHGGSPAGAAAAAAVAGNALVVVVALPFALPLGPAGAADWGWVAYLGLFQIAWAYRFMTRGVRRVPALEGALLLLLEPVLNTAWAWALHGEVPGPWSRLGAAVILVATGVHSVRAARKRPAPRTAPPRPPPVRP